MCIKTIPAVRLSAYHDAHGPVRLDTFRDMAALAAAQGNPAAAAAAGRGALRATARGCSLSGPASPPRYASSTSARPPGPPPRTVPPAGRDWPHRWVVRMHKVR